MMFLRKSHNTLLKIQNLILFWSNKYDVNFVYTATKRFSNVLAINQKNFNSAYYAGYVTIFSTLTVFLFPQ